MPRKFLSHPTSDFSAEASRFIRHLLDNVREGIAVLDRDLKYVLWNPYLERLTGLREREIKGRNIFEVFPSLQGDSINGQLQKALGGEVTMTAEMKLPPEVKSEPRVLAVEYQPFRVSDGEVIGVMVTARDMTEHRENRNKIARLTRIYAVLSGINSAIVRIHDRQLLLQEACRIATQEGDFLTSWIGLLQPGSLEGEIVAVAGAEMASLRLAILTADPDSKHRDRPACRAARTGQTVVCNDIEREPAFAELHQELLAKNHRSMAAFPLKVDNRVVGVLSLFAGETGFFDETEMKLLNELAGDIGFGLQYIEKEEQLNYLAYYDPLTGLPNRNFFLEQLSHALQAASRSSNKLVINIGDVQQFQQINDTFGRNAGDALIREMAARLKPFVRNPEYLSRISSACFATILPDISDVSEVAQRVERAHAAPLDRPFMIGGQPISVRMAVGIAVYPDDGLDAETLFGKADAALKQAKSAGLPYLFYQPSIRERVAEKLRLEHRLRRAIANREFILHYQPKVNSRTSEIVGLEALIRWNDPEEGMIGPDRFIPVLEETGLIAQVGKWVIRQALADFRAWQQAGLTPPRIAVNVSIKQLREASFIDEVSEAIAAEEACASALELEITESLFMEDIAAVIEILKAVRKLGITMSIDDFGTGYSSLSYLSKLPVHALKIDRTFINSMITDPDNLAIVSTVISLAHSLDLRVVAEGVETEETAKFLRLLKCDEMQGFYFSRPLPFEQIREMLAPQEHRKAYP